MTDHSWEKTLEIERHGNIVLDALFSPEFLVIPATDLHQHQKIDRFHISRRDGRVVHRVDYKVDKKAGETGNLVIEHVSVERDGRRESPGWIHTTIADLIVSYVPAKDTAFVMEVRAIREAWHDIVAHCELKETGTSGPRRYTTKFYCAPIDWLRRQGLLSRTLEAVGVQGRLF